jgi:hypothetical protein
MAMVPVAVFEVATAAAVLELLRMGTYVKYPYLEFYKYRARVLLLVLSQV